VCSDTGGARDCSHSAQFWRSYALAIDRSGYDLVGTLNGSNGKLYGVELAYLQQFDFLPGALSGFGFQGNVAFIGGSFDTLNRIGADFPGTSDRIVNASLFYEKYGLSARVSYQYRTDWVDTLGGLGVGAPSTCCGRARGKTRCRNWA